MLTTPTGQWGYGKLSGRGTARGLRERWRQEEAERWDEQGVTLDELWRPLLTKSNAIIQDREREGKERLEEEDCFGHMTFEVSVELRYMGLKHKKGSGLKI